MTEKPSNDGKWDNLLIQATDLARPEDEKEVRDRAKKTILVVEDDEASREGAALALRDAGFGVFALPNGREALDYLRTKPPPDLILLDMLMPVLDGWHFLERLQREGPQPRPPIVITTGTILTREWARDKGCAGFIRKPIDPEALLAEVRRCMGE